jgi:hypothetical protein
MTILHILRSEPSELVRRLIQGMSRGHGSQEVPLYQGSVDYDRLVKDIFQADRVVCWW